LNSTNASTGTKPHTIGAASQYPRNVPVTRRDAVTTAAATMTTTNTAHQPVSSRNVMIPDTTASWTAARTAASSRLCAGPRPPAAVTTAATATRITRPRTSGTLMGMTADDTR